MDLVPQVTALAREVHPAISLQYTSFADQVAASVQRPRLLATLSGFFGALALLLAMIGLYGTMAYGVARRRTEIGVRLALGAAQGRVLRMVLGEVGLVVGLGLVLGLVMAFAATRLIGTFLYRLTPTDPSILIGASLLLALAALAAGAVPAWRAARLDPMSALREE